MQPMIVRNNPSKILEGLYHGNVENALDRSGCLDRFGIKNIVSILDGQGCECYVRERLLADANGANKDINYLHIDIDDKPFEYIDIHFSKAIEFIHEARMAGKGAVLVHCILGVSRSTTIVVAYLMTITCLGWETCLNAIKKRRPIAQPNDSFLRQLVEYQTQLAKLQWNRLPPEMQQYRLYPSREDDVKTVKQLDRQK